MFKSQISIVIESGYCYCFVMCTIIIVISTNKKNKTKLYSYMSDIYIAYIHIVIDSKKY